MSAAHRPIRNLILSPLCTSVIAAIQGASIGLALIVMTVHGTAENQLGLIREEIGKERVRPADRTGHYEFK